jgi:hypothetical protein
MTLAVVDSDYTLLAASWVDRSVQFVRDFQAVYPSVPEPGSTADTEINHNSVIGPSGPWSAEATVLPYDVAGGILPIALRELLVSLKFLLVPEMALFGFQAVARGIVEGATRAAWVLDPAIDVRERVVRGGLLELESIIEAKRVEDASGSGDGSAYNRSILELRTRMATLGIAEGVNGVGRVVGFDGQVLSTKTDAVKEFLPLLGVAHGEMWYRQMSGISHSVLYGITTYLRAQPIAGTKRGIPVPELPLIAVANAVVLSIAAYLFVIERHAQLWGRDAASVTCVREEAARELLSATSRPRSLGS